MITPIELAGNVGALSHAPSPTTRRPRSRCSATISCSTTSRPTRTSTHRASKRSSPPGSCGRRRRAARPWATASTSLSRLVTISDDDVLNDGTKRGLAASMLTYFPLLAPQLDVRIPVVVPYGTDPDDTVEIGSYCDLQRLFGQLLTDEPAQLVLGAMTERYRVAETAGLAASIAARPGDDASEHRARIAAALADVSAIGALVLRLARGAHLARRVRARPRRRTREVGGLVGDRDRFGRRAVIERGAPRRSRSPPRSSPPRSTSPSRPGCATSASTPHRRSASP